MVRTMGRHRGRAGSVVGWGLLLLAMAAALIPGSVRSQDVQESISRSISRGVSEGVSSAARSSATRPTLLVNRTPARITGMRLSSSADVLVIMTSDGLARTWSLRTGQLAATARLRDPANMASVAVSDRLEAATLRRNGGAELLDLMTGRIQ